MTESNNIYDILAKIDWEGGIPAVLEWGMRDIEEYDVPDSLKDAWADMAQVYEEFEALMEDVYAEMHQAQNRAEEE